MRRHRPGKGFVMGHDAMGFPLYMLATQEILPAFTRRSEIEAMVVAHVRETASQSALEDPWKGEEAVTTSEPEPSRRLW